MKKVQKFSMMGGALAAAFGVSFVAGTALAADGNDETVRIEHSMNAEGISFGSFASEDVNTLKDADIPDLILVENADGLRGYVYKKDLFPSTPRTLDEAIEQEAAAKDGRVINMYESDGRTVIGQFQVGDPTG